MQRDYADDYRGWPVAPRTRQHPVRGSFLDPRTGAGTGPVYHHGIDVSLRDDRPEPGAPSGGAYRVFALEGGIAWGVMQPVAAGRGGQVRVGHFGYGHVLPLVRNGQKVKPGQLIGWTARGFWHLHLSEWLLPHGIPRTPIPAEDRSKVMIPVNPLDPRGKIAPYVDTAPPEISEIRFWSPANPAWRTAQGRAVFPVAGVVYDQLHLSGKVDVRVRIEDEQSFLGWWTDMPELETWHHPARVRVRVMRFATGKDVVDREVFDADRTLAGAMPFSHHYAPGTRQNLRAETVVRTGKPGRGQLWLRPLATKADPYWDTTKLPNGRYRIVVTAWDVAGNRAQRSTDVVIENR